jgi:hypothetical protein
MISSAYTCVVNPIHSSPGPTNVLRLSQCAFRACDNSSRHRLHSNWLSGRLCLTSRFHSIVSDLVPPSSIPEFTPWHRLPPISCVHCRKFCCYMTNIISSWGTDPKAFVKSIDVTIELSLFLLASCSSSLNMMPCSLQRFVFLMSLFWLSEERCTFELGACIVCADRQVKIR